MDALIPLVVSLLLILACGAFVAAEFSFITVNRAAVESAAGSGDRGAQNVLAGLRTLSTQLSGAQVGITVTNLAIGFMAEPAIASLVVGPLEDAGLASGAARTVSVTIALVVATTLTMVFGELVPKNLAISRPLPTAKAVQGFQRGFTRSIAYVIRFCNDTANRILRRMGIEPQEELASARSPEELAGLVRHSAAKGTLAVDTATLVQRTLAFSERSARDVMTPRMRTTTVRQDASVLDLILTAQQTGHSRFPVVHAADDDVVGVAHIRHALQVPFDDRDRVLVRDVMAEPTSVPDTMSLDDLLGTLQAGGLQLGLVIDEFGSVAGMVTLEDLVEELVGDVVDEHDDEDASAEQSDDHTWVLSGLLRPDEAARVIGVPVPEDSDYDTLGGLIASRLGRLADPGDTVLIPPDDDGSPGAAGVERPTLLLTVTAVDGHRVDRVRVEVRRGADAAADDADDGGRHGEVSR